MSLPPRCWPVFQATSVLRTVALIITGIVLIETQSGRAESFAFTTAAGSAGQMPVLGTSGDGTNSAARFKNPAGMALDSNTNLYLTDGSAVRRMTRTGTNWVVTTLAGDIARHASADGSNNVAGFDDPQGIAVDASGVLYVADTLNNSIRKVVASGTNWVVTTIAGLSGRPNTGNADGSNDVARFDHPYGVAVDAGGNLFIVDTSNQTIRKATPSGTNWVVTTIAGSAGVSGTADGTNKLARFDSPVAITVDTLGNFFVADFNNNTIRKGSPSGTNWIVTTVAGLAPVPGSADGSNSNARFFQPQGIAVDSFGNLYVSDSGNNTIRKIKPVGTNWVVITLGGQVGVPGDADGIGSVARFDNPYDLALSPAGTLFVADSWNNTIRSAQVAMLMDYKLTANRLVVSWPLLAAANGFRPEVTTSLSAGPWIQQSSGIVTNGDTCFVTNSIAPGNAFYRLHKP